MLEMLGRKVKDEERDQKLEEGGGRDLKVGLQEDLKLALKLQQEDLKLALKLQQGNKDLEDETLYLILDVSILLVNETLYLILDVRLVKKRNISQQLQAEELVLKKAALTRNGFKKQ